MPHLFTGLFFGYGLDPAWRYSLNIPFWHSLTPLLYYYTYLFA
jgi:hypothetical protein